jgi:hypothetical protein
LNVSLFLKVEANSILTWAGRLPQEMVDETNRIPSSRAIHSATRILASEESPSSTDPDSCRWRIRPATCISFLIVAFSFDSLR